MARKKFYKSELTVSCESNARNKNLMGILISILVLMLISSIIVLAIVVANPEIVGQSARSFYPREAITLEEAMLNELGAASFVHQWLPSPGKDELLFEESKNIRIMSLPAPGANKPSNNNSQAPLSSTMMGKFAASFKPDIATLISNSSLLSSIDYQGFKLSPSKRYLLVWTARKKQFRHSFTARYFIYDIQQDLISLLSVGSAHPDSLAASRAEARDTTFAANRFEHLDSAAEYLNSRSADERSARFQCVEWFQSKSHSADSWQDSLILIHDNDLYLLANVSSGGDAIAASSSSPPLRLTFTGRRETIFNGIPDWLYEEEILSDVAAFQVSPKAGSLAYMAFNDSQVDTMPFSVYGPNEQIYPQVQQIRYPKSGRVNPRVTVHVVDDLTSDDTSKARRRIDLMLPDDLARQQHYISRINWLTEDRLALIWMNRSQNELYVVLCSRQLNWRCEKNLHMKSDGGWLDLMDSEPLLLDESHYVTVMLKAEGPDVGEFKHLAKVSLDKQNSYTFLTGGRREVTAINGFDKDSGSLFYTSTIENEPGQRQVYAYNVQTGQESCLTCELHPPGECLFYSASLSQSGRYIVLDCEGPAVPRTELRSIEAILSGSQRAAQRSKSISARAAELSSSKTVGQQLAENSKELDQQQSGPTKQDSQVSASNQTARALQDQQDEDPSLLWLVEDNRELREKLQNVKAMPLTMRLRVPIPKTNYSANVMLLLPPQLGAGSTVASSILARSFQQRLSVGRSKRAAAMNRHRSTVGLEQPLGAYLTQQTIGDYVDQLGSGQQYPMVVDVYAGPGSQKVDYRFHIGFGHYLASSRRTVYAMIDGRGSGYQGTKRLYELYRRFGTVEIEDQIEVASWLARTYTFIDPARVAIWGWSYGGYAAAMALAQSNARGLQDFHLKVQHLGRSNSSRNLFESAPNGPQLAVSSLLAMNGVFECAASVAPVTNWIYYDTAYTERYMSSPYTNDLYDESSAGDHNKPAGEQVSQQADWPQANRWIPLSSSKGSGWHNLSSPLAALMRTQSAGATKRANGLDLNEHYMRASLIDQVANIDRRRFLLIHGTADDNVHFQQSIFLMKRLIQKNVMFETRLYPDQDHGIANKADKLHLGSTLSNFFAECFDMAY